MRRFYAEGTEVSVGKSRGEVIDLLHRRGCDKLGWAEELDEGRSVLQFVWSHHGGQKYLARFAIRIPTDAELAERAVDGRTKKPSAAKLEKLRAGRGRAEHRQLLLWLRACFTAVDAGIIAPEQVFLPWLVGRDGRTVWETAQPRLPELLARDARALLLGDGSAA